MRACLGAPVRDPQNSALSQREMKSCPTSLQSVFLNACVSDWKPAAAASKQVVPGRIIVVSVCCGCFHLTKAC